MDIFATTLALIGGLGMFLFGMKLMSEGIEKSAGAKLRGILEFFTKNKFFGMLVGIAFTAIVQSSSACTVMVVSFVNSGLMNLYQAAGVIFGANIGTTVTSLLVSLNLSQLAPLFLFIGVIAVMFCKNQNVRKIGEVIIGFGILFMGISMMSDAMSGLRDSQEVIDILSNLSNPIVALLVGLVLTAIIQSSSVTVSIVVLMASQGMIELPMTFYIILGCNIGSCGSALLASLAGKKDAKRAAMIHFLFNVFGSVVIVILLQFLNAPLAAVLNQISGGEAGRSVALAHITFKVFQTIILFPFSSLLVKLTYLLIPGKEEKVNYRENYQLNYIGSKVVFNPSTAVVEVIKELERMASLASENLTRAMNALVTLDEDDIAEVYEVEKNINFLNHAITDYLVKINQSPLPIDDLKSMGALFHVVNDIERIGDHAENVADAAKQRRDDGIEFSKDAQKELGEMLEMVTKIVRYAVDMFVHNSEEHLNEILQIEDTVDQMERELQRKHVERLTSNECTPEAGMIFSDVVSGLERVADHATNIAFSILHGNQDEEEEEESEA